MCDIIDTIVGKKWHIHVYVVQRGDKMKKKKLCWVDRKSRGNDNWIRELWEVYYHRDNDIVEIIADYGGKLAGFAMIDIVIN